MSTLLASEIIEIARHCRDRSSTDPLGPIQGKEIVKFARRIEDHLLPRTPGRRDSDIEKDAQITKLTAALLRRDEQIDALIAESKHLIEALKLSDALRNRERGLGVGVMTMGDQYAHQN